MEAADERRAKEWLCWGQICTKQDGEENGGRRVSRLLSYRHMRGVRFHWSMACDAVIKRWLTLLRIILAWSQSFWSFFSPLWEQTTFTTRNLMCSSPSIQFRLRKKSWEVEEEVSTSFESSDTPYVPWSVQRIISCYPRQMDIWEDKGGVILHLFVCSCLKCAASWGKCASTSRVVQLWDHWEWAGGRWGERREKFKRLMGVLCLKCVVRVLCCLSAPSRR